MDALTIITHALLFTVLYTEVFLLLVFLETSSSETRRETRLSLADLPAVAIVVPCFNEEKTVAGTLRSLLALDYPKNKLSIIAVDDGSTDGTAHALADFAHEPQVAILHKANGGKQSAMNLALAHTKADYIGCLDADSFVAPRALMATMQRFSETGAAAVTPAIVIRSPRRWIELVQQAEYALSVFMRRAFAGANAVFITPGPFSIFRRDVLAKLGGWRHAHGTEDMELALRLQEHGYVIANSPETTVYTTPPECVRGLYRQRVRWTYGFLMNAWDYRRMVGNRAHGALGTVVLPAAIMSIVTALYFTSVTVAYAAGRLWDAYVRVDTVGMPGPHIPSFDMFFINTTSAMLMAYILIALALALIFVGKRLSQTKLHPLAVPLYIFCYSFLAPLWLAGAVVRAGLHKQAPWR